MTKIVKILDGPYNDGDVVWLVCELTDGRGTFWTEEIYYDTMEEAFADFNEINEWGIDLEEDDYIEEDELHD